MQAAGTRSQRQPVTFPLALLAIMLASVAGSLVLGRDLNWDFLNYHFYGASLLVEGRLEQDYFAASLQSYLNPVAYVPQYLMIQAGWHSAWIGVVLAAVHALNLVFAALIARCVLPSPSDRTVTVVMLAVVLAFLAPLFLTTTGTSFSDPTTSVAVLAALWLLLDGAPGRPTARACALAGLLLGAATGLKLTNAVLAVGLTLPFAISWLYLDWRNGARATAGLFLAGVAGLALAHGHWSFELWRTFGNPFFPLFNGVFASPDFPAITFRDERFVASGPGALLALPFEMLRPVSWLYAENVAVDARFAVLASLVVLVGTRALFARLWFSPRPPARLERTDPGPARHRLLLLSVAFLAAYFLWGLSSKIGRYALPLWLLLGPLVMAWAALLLCRQHHLLFFGCLLVVVQAGVLWMAGNPRWSPSHWAPSWLEVSVPPSLSQRPSSLMTMGTQSYSFVVPFLHPETRVVNLVGQYMQPAGDRMTSRLKLLLRKEPLYVAFRDRELKSPYSPYLAAATRADVDAVLSVYGLKLSSRQCEPLVMSMPIDTEVNVFRPGDRDSRDANGAPDFERLHVCSVDQLAADRFAAAVSAKRSIDLAFDRVEASCGRKLSPHGTETLRGRDGWLRNYFNSQRSLSTDGEVVFVRPFRGMVDTAIGPLEHWQSEATPMCPSLPNPITQLR